VWVFKPDELVNAGCEYQRRKLQYGEQRPRIFQNSRKKLKILGTRGVTLGSLLRTNKYNASLLNTLSPGRPGVRDLGTPDSEDHSFVFAKLWFQISAWISSVVRVFIVFLSLYLLENCGIVLPVRARTHSTFHILPCAVFVITQWTAYYPSYVKRR